jgi:PAS domain S-box-containing protein
MTSPLNKKVFTVLIVDDESSVRYVKSRVLKRHGYAVVEAVNGREALTIAAERQPHVVLLDIKLPDISGYEVCRQLKSNPCTKDIMVLQTSAVHVGWLDRTKGIDSGADAYLIEPAEEEEIVCAVRALIRLAEHARENRRLIERLSESERHMATEYADAKLLQDLSGELIHEQPIESLYEKIVDAAVTIMRSDYGTLQSLYPEDGPGGKLRLLAFRGFSLEAAEEFKWVPADAPTTCAVALRTKQRLVVPDFEQCDFMAGTQALAAHLQAGVYAAQSTPLIGRNGNLVGMLSTHWRQPHHPSHRELRLLDVLARQAADLIDRKRAEERLRDSEARFRTMADVSPVIIWVTDAKGGIEFINQAYRTFFGVTEEDVQDQRWRFLIHPEDAQQYVDEYMRCVREQAPFYARGRVRRAGGTWRWIASYGAPRFSSTGEFLGHAGSSPDIHDLIIAQQAVQEHAERLRLAMEGGEMGAWEIDLGTGTVIWDAKQHAIFGQPMKDTPKNMSEFYALLHPDDLNRIQQAAAASELTGRFSEEFRIIRPDGAVRWIAGHGATISDAAGRPVRMVGINYDITERKESQAKLETSAQELGRQVDERTHELVQSQDRLRSLTAEMALTEQRERQKLAQDLHDYLAQMLTVGQMKTAMAKKQLEWSAANKAFLEDLGKVFQQALSYTRTLIAELSPPSFRDYGLPGALKWLKEQMEKDGLWVDVESRCEQVPLSEEQAVLVFLCVRELVINVLKHAGIDRATVRCTVDEQEVRVIVADRGKGFDVDAVQRPAEAGHLGLGSVRERIESLNGRIEVVSAIGEGTTVILVLPRAKQKRLEP